MNDYLFVMFEWFMDSGSFREFTVRALNEEEARNQARSIGLERHKTFNHTAVHFIGKAAP